MKYYRCVWGGIKILEIPKSGMDQNWLGTTWLDSTTTVFYKNGFGIR